MEERPQKTKSQIKKSTIGSNVIYIQEKEYGFRFSKYAAKYRKMWKYTNEKGEPLVAWKNVATIKLIKNPHYQKGTKRKLIGGDKDITHLGKAAKHDRSAIYVTLPSVVRVKNWPEKGKPRASAFTHSEHIIASALKQGYKKEGLEKKREEELGKGKEKKKEEEEEEQKEKKDYPAYLDPYDHITDGGKYLIKWIYTERAPCLESLYHHPCKNFIEGLAQTQYSRSGLPIEVYYSVPYEYQEDLSLKANMDDTMHLDRGQYPLSSNPDTAIVLERDLMQDVALGSLIIREIGVDTENIDLSETQMKEYLEKISQSAIEEKIKEIEKSIEEIQQKIDYTLKVDKFVAEMTREKIENSEDVKQLNPEFYERYYKKNEELLKNRQEQLKELDSKIQKNAEIQEKIVFLKSKEQILREYETKFKKLACQLFDVHLSQRDADTHNKLMQKCQKNLSNLNSVICNLRRAVYIENSDPVIDDELIVKMENKLINLKMRINEFCEGQAKKEFEEKMKIEQHNKNVIPVIASSSKLSSNPSALHHPNKIAKIELSFSFKNASYTAKTTRQDALMITVEDNDHDKLKDLKNALLEKMQEKELKDSDILIKEISIEGNNKWMVIIPSNKVKPLFEKIQSALLSLSNETLSL